MTSGHLTHITPAGERWDALRIAITATISRLAKLIEVNRDLSDIHVPAILPRAHAYRPYH